MVDAEHGIERGRARESRARRQRVVGVMARVVVVGGRLGWALVGPGWPSLMVHASCSTACRPAVHRRLWAEGGAWGEGVELVRVWVTRASSRTGCYMGLWL